jgi:hypothetical protein
LSTLRRTAGRQDTDALIERLAKLETGQVSDVLDEAGVPITR